MSNYTEAGEDFLSHYGVKGMRWGQTKSSLSGAMEARKTKVAAANAVRNSPKDVTVTTQLKGKKYQAKAKGGEKQPINEDAVRAHTSRQKLKKSGVDALSNKELQELSTRMNLEQQVNSLNSKRPKTKGQEFINKAMKDPVKTYETASKGADTLKKLRK